MIETLLHRNQMMHRVTMHRGIGRDSYHPYEEDPRDGRPSYQARCVCGWKSVRLFQKWNADKVVCKHLEGKDINGWGEATTEM
ncbi:hypothetical protein SEA_GODONK_20 [Gordonia phage GodonK]|uniref:Uncharacterized protein n=1 Tax=Gordonia phage GodonK TaxID=2562192 RepID=A0A4D6E1U5_9CAUD|nr:hypothetical protein HOV33_gp020 [Gordonia phage GodonK]QBZ72639.1 hypothetical protein SEA_GODONK_20 [Gordonia phage GodonK]